LGLPQSQLNLPSVATIPFKRLYLGLLLQTLKSSISRTHLCNLPCHCMHHHLNLHHKAVSPHSHLLLDSLILQLNPCHIKTQSILHRSQRHGHITLWVLEWAFSLMKLDLVLRMAFSNQHIKPRSSQHVQDPTKMRLRRSALRGSRQNMTTAHLEIYSRILLNQQLQSKMQNENGSVLELSET
jgi:hypothetical protein